MKKTIKFLLTAILVLFATFSVACKDDKPVDPDSPDVTKEPGFYLHYHRYDNKYTKWGLWLWETDGEGADFIFNGQDDYGVWAKYAFSDWTDQTGINFLVKTEEWAKDPDGDRRIVYSDFEKDSKGDIHVYLLTQDEKLYKSSADALTPKVVSAQFATSKTIFVVTTEKATSYQLYENEDKIVEENVDAKDFSITLPHDADISKTYKVIAKFGKSQSSELQVSTNPLYDTESFIANYVYNGNDLGVKYSKQSSTFKLWAPISKNVELRVYDSGTPKSVNAQLGNDTYATHKMTKSEKGVWNTTINGDLDAKYYTYMVVNGDKSFEVVDPYAKSTGIDGLRGMILDFSKTNPEGWDNVSLSDINSAADLIVYELHVRDLTMDDTWNGTKANKGKFLGLTEEGTTYTKDGVTVKTGFDHIKELGVNAVQLLPIFDYKNDTTETSSPFNWGYNPLNFNAVEGSYSANPYDGAAKVNELKQVIQAYAKADIRIIMDVVYNHVNDANASNFNKIVPGYYFRYDKSGSLSNGSGCGNETASERAMMSKFIVDSTSFWASEYKLGGYRFDLMGLHDKKTMENVASETKKINDDFVVYGEPWQGGSSPLDKDQACTNNPNNIKDLANVGAFNDTTRDAIKGSVFESAEGGWLNRKGGGNTTDKTKVIAGITGGVAVPGSDSIIYGDPARTVNYVSCHDNNTLFDKLTLTGVGAEEIAQTDVFANAIILTSQGIAFINSGEEIMRQKVLPDGTLDHNSYKSSDEVNSLKWDRKITYLKEFNQYKDLIALRKAISLFTMGSAKEVSDSLVVLTKLGTTDLDYTTIAYTIEKDGKKILVIHNIGEAKEVTIDGNYTVGIDISNTYSKDAAVSGKVNIKKNSTLVLMR